MVQRTGPVPGETQEEPSQESTHSAQSLHAPQAFSRFKHSKHRQVVWPPANKERDWLQFDEDLDQVLDATARGDADQKLLSMSAMIVSIGAERFGIKEQQPTKRLGEPNRREVKISRFGRSLDCLDGSLRWQGRRRRLG